MSGHSPSVDQSRIVRFWDRYIEYVHKQGAKPPFDRWYVIRAEQYLGSVERKLREHTQQDLDTWLSELGKNTTLKDWQIQQAADAIRILLSEIAGHS